MTQLSIRFSPPLRSRGVRVVLGFNQLFFAVLFIHLSNTNAGECQSYKPFVWQLGDGPQTSFLMGSIHLAHPDIYPLPAAVEDAFSACDDLIVEANPEAMNEADMQHLLLLRSVDTSGRPLAEKIPPETLQELRRLVEKHPLEMGMLDRLNPWYIAQIISLLELKRLGVDPQRGIDLHFIKKASGTKSVLELEGIEQQLELFDGMTEFEQSLMLQYTVRDLEHLEEAFGDIISAWKSGDPERLDELLTAWMKGGEGLEAVFEKLFTERNKQMKLKISRFLQDGKRHFIIVGAGHLVGQEGLLHLLAKDGFTVRQIGTKERIEGIFLEK